MLGKNSKKMILLYKWDHFYRVGGHFCRGAIFSGRVVLLTVYGLRLLEIFESDKGRFGNFRLILVEFRVQKCHLLVGTQCPN